MAQIRCPECGCDISEGVSKCPFCECVIKIHNADTGYSGYENGKISNESRLHEDDRALKYKFVAGLFFVLALFALLQHIQELIIQNTIFIKSIIINV